MSGGLSLEILIEWQARKSDVIDDTNTKMISGLGLDHLVEHALDHRRGEFLRTQAVTPADDPRRRSTRILRVVITGGTPVPHGFADRGDDILIQRFSGTAGFFGSIQNGDRLDRQGQG